MVMKINIRTAISFLEQSEARGLKPITLIINSVRYEVVLE